MAKEDDKQAEEGKSKGGIGIGVLVGAVVLAIGASAGISFFVMNKAVSEIKATAGGGDEGKGGEGEPAAPKGPALYLALDPAFVVNLNDPDASRYLQVQVQVMSRDAHTIEAVKNNEPAIRSELLLLFGQQKSENLQTRAGKEALQQQVLDDIKKIVKAETGEDNVEAVYFTSFVIQ